MSLSSKNYRTIVSGENKRREYLSLNNSPLFLDLPNSDLSQEQKSSYNEFLFKRLESLLFSNFPKDFKDYNNEIVISVEKVEVREPEIKEDEARDNSLTWNYGVFLDWCVSWKCNRMQMPNKNDDIQLDMSNWLKESFKIGEFVIEEINSDSWRVKENKSNGIEMFIKKKDKEEEEDPKKAVDEKNKNLENKYYIIEFNYKEVENINFCHLPKINNQGNFIINGHDKTVVFQSVRAPSIYFFSNKDEEFYGEIIPFKGPWISIYQNPRNPKSIELKFLNSKVIVNVLEIFKTFSLSEDLLKRLFDQNLLDLSEYGKIKSLERGNTSSNFLSNNKENSPFDLGRLCRKKYNRKFSIIEQVKGCVLSEDLLDKDGEIMLRRGEKISDDNLEKLKRSLKFLPPIEIPNSDNSVYLIKVKSPKNKSEEAFIIGTDYLSEEKTYLDLADFVCIISSLINLRHGIGIAEREEEKDKLENQIVRRVGDLIYNLFDNKFNNFLQNIKNRYVANISQLRKADITKMPYLREFDAVVKNSFNTSPLVQLQNQNNPLSEASYTRKVSVLGLGGFSSSNTTLTARNVNSSHYGCYDLVETPEGQRVGLIHNLTIGAAINEYGQIAARYYVVKNGVVTPEMAFLTSDESWEKYMAHCNIRIDEKNIILDQKILVRYKGELIFVERERIDYIDSSFYQLNSITSATIPFFSHNDATRLLMATNMQRQATTLFKSETPLVASGIEANLLNNSSLVVRAEEEGEVIYVDNKKVIIRSKNKEDKVYSIKQLVASNKNVLLFSKILVKKGDKVKKDQIISHGNYGDKGELALGRNLRVAWLCWKGRDYEDAFIVNERLVRDDILTSLYAKEHTVILRETKIGPEKLTASFSNTPRSELPHLDDEGIVKIGSEVRGNDILVGKITPEALENKETEEELLLMSIMGDKTQKYVNTSLRLPAGEEGMVYDVKREKLKGKNEIEKIKIYVVHERKIEIGDKLTTRFGNKGVVAEIVRNRDMPYDENGETVDIIFNPLGVPSRMNIGQLLEAIFASAAHKLGINLLVRPFNTPLWENMMSLIKEAGIENFGARKMFDGMTGLPFDHDVFVGYVYTVKLNHMVADKFNARNTGSYSLIFQQPPKGRAKEGGQRVGEMEAWVLEALGASWNLMEMMSIKSDDMLGRLLTKMSLLWGDREVSLNSSRSESFNLLINYLLGIGFDIRATDFQGKEIDFYEFFTGQKRKK